jgi:hypothetical protein
LWETLLGIALSLLDLVKIGSRWRMLGHVSKQEMKLSSFPNCWILPYDLSPCIPIPWNLVMSMLFRPSKTCPL